MRRHALPGQLVSAILNKQLLLGFFDLDVLVNSGRMLVQILMRSPDVGPHGLHEAGEIHLVLGLGAGA